MNKKNKLQKEKNGLNLLFMSLVARGILIAFICKIIFSGIFSDAGAILTATAVLAFLPVALYLKSEDQGAELKTVYKKITVQKFLFFFLLSFLLNFLVSQTESIFELFFRLLGMSAKPDVAATGSVSLLYFLYVCIFAPVFEELTYRGAMFHGLKKYGTTFAVVLSAFCFGIMHHDFYQGLVAFGGGLIYGYVAGHYSLFAAVGLHIADNSFALLIPLLKKTGPLGADIILGVVAASVIAGVVALIKYIMGIMSRKECGNNTTIEKKYFFYSPVWKCVPLWCLLILDIVYLIMKSFYPV